MKRRAFLTLVAACVIASQEVFGRRPVVDQAPAPTEKSVDVREIFALDDKGRPTRVTYYREKGGRWTIAMEKPDESFFSVQDKDPGDGIDRNSGLAGNSGGRPGFAPGPEHAKLVDVGEANEAACREADRVWAMHAALGGAVRGKTSHPLYPPYLAKLDLS
jgi:hypothetical protein